jgi:hypothetical protein
MNNIHQFDYLPLFRFCRIKGLALDFILTLNQYTAIPQRLYFGLELVDPFCDRRNVYSLLPKLYQPAQSFFYVCRLRSISRQLPTESCNSLARATARLTRG